MGGFRWKQDDKANYGETDPVKLHTFNYFQFRKLYRRLILSEVGYIIWITAVMLRKWPLTNMASSGRQWTPQTRAKEKLLMKITKKKAYAMRQNRFPQKGNLKPCINDGKRDCHIKRLCHQFE